MTDFNLSIKRQQIWQKVESLRRRFTSSELCSPALCCGQNLFSPVSLLLGVFSAVFFGSHSFGAAHKMSEEI